MLPVGPKLHHLPVRLIVMILLHLYSYVNNYCISFAIHRVRPSLFFRKSANLKAINDFGIQKFLEVKHLHYITAKQIDELNICWNSVVRKVFGYHKWESVSAVLLGLNVEHLIMLRKMKFYRHLLYDCDAFLCNVFF